MPAFVADNVTAAEATIASSGFWPNIEPSHCRSVMRMDTSITAERLREALISAIIAIGLDHGNWVAQQQLAGYATLLDIPADTIDDDSIQLHRYRRAVYCTAKAELLERYADFDSTGAGFQRAVGGGQQHDASLNEAADDYRRQAIIALRDMTGRSRTTIELI